MITLNVFNINKDRVKPTLISKIRFSELEKIARLTYREDDESFFQRNTDMARVKKISEFIQEKILYKNTLRDQSDVLALFPTSIILALGEKDDEEYYHLNGDTVEIEEGRFAYIVDGQHRYAGIKKFYEETGLSYSDFDIELPLIILLDHDLYEQATIFMDVNFKQRPVNKSFYYDIFGSLPGKRSKLQLSHYLVKYLNTTEKSPFYMLVKMLGTGDGIVSQAFLGESILKLLTPGSVFSSLYYDYEKGGDQHKEIAKVILSYFDSAKKAFKDYVPRKNIDNRYSSSGQDILFKTTGIGALTKLLNSHTSDILKIYTNQEELIRYFDYIFSLINKEEAHSLFSKDGDFAKGGGGGLQSKLYNKLQEIMEYKKDIVGNTYENAEILDVKKTKDPQNNDVYDLTLHNKTTNDQTTTRINYEILSKIKIGNQNH